jgi:LacI family transcriptional regulator
MLRRVLKTLRIPYVVLNRHDPQDNFVCNDNVGGMASLVDRLAEGAKQRGVVLKPIYIGYEPVREISGDRARGFSMGCRRNRVELGDEDVIHVKHLQDMNDGLFDMLKRRGVNAVATFNDITSVYFYQAALHRGYRIPEDIMLVGYDNSPVSELLEKRIDTIDMETSRLGYMAAEWLRRVVIERNPDPIHEMVHGSYVPGQTIFPG